MKRKKWVNKVIALLLAAIMIVPSSLGTVAYAQEPEVSSEQTQVIQNADENISEASEGIVLCNKLLSEDTVEEDDEF